MKQKHNGEAKFKERRREKGDLTKCNVAVGKDPGRLLPAQQGTEEGRLFSLLGGSCHNYPLRDLRD